MQLEVTSKIHAAEEFLRDEQRAGFLVTTHVVHIDDVRVVHAPCGPRLSQESRDRIGVQRCWPEHHLHRDAPLGHAVNALVDRTHASVAEQTNEFVPVGENGADECLQLIRAGPREHRRRIDAIGRAHQRQAMARFVGRRMIVWP